MLTGTKINKSYLVLLCFFTASYDSLNSLWHGHTLLMIRISSAGSNQLKKKNHFYHTAVGYIITATIGWSEQNWLSCYYGLWQGVGYVRQQVNMQVFRLMCMSMGLIRALSVLYIFLRWIRIKNWHDLLISTPWIWNPWQKIPWQKIPWRQDRPTEFPFKWIGCGIRAKKNCHLNPKAHLCKLRLVSLVWL